MAREIKTNVMRILEREHIPYDRRFYTVEDDSFDGHLVAEKTGLDPSMVYKTLVLTDDRLGHLVCVIPVERELDLKKCAKAGGHRSVSMLPLKDLLPLTGYVRGGCSPVGMKKLFPTFLDRSAQALPTLSVSAGARGCQILLSPPDLIRLCHGVYADLVRDE